MNILHLASFDGNVGDNASHIGFQKILKTLSTETHQVDNLEIRKFYNNYSLSDKHAFNTDFAKLVNGYDLLFIGGGGFLDFDIPGSLTGTTIALGKDILDKIRIPVMIGSIGCNPRNTIPDGNIEKFTNFLEDFLPRENTFLAVRNDGSTDALRKYIGNEYAESIPEVLDHGFFYENDGTMYKPTLNKYILINTTSDQVLMANRITGELDPESYIRQMIEVIEYIIQETNYDIVFAPHIYSDLKAIDRLITKINDFHVRTRIFITPYAQGNYGCDQIFSAYKNSSMVIGMRFHANVCSIAMDVPSIGVAALDRVERVYESFDLGDCVVQANSDFSKSLLEKVNILPASNPLFGKIGELYTQKCLQTLNIYREVLTNWGLI